MRNRRQFAKNQQNVQEETPEAYPSGRTADISIFDTPTVQIPAMPIGNVQTTSVEDASLERFAVSSIVDRTTASLPIVRADAAGNAHRSVWPSTVPITPPVRDTLAELKLRAREQVESYIRWLENNNSLQTSADAIQAYQNAAMEIKKVGNRNIRTFAPFREQISALRVITPMQVIILMLLILSWGVGFYFLHLTAIAITLGAVTLLYITGFVASGILSTNSFRGNSGEKIDEDIIRALDQIGIEWPSYTILCPLYKETAVVPQFVEAIKALEYPEKKLQVLLLTEEKDEETRAALYHTQLPAYFSILTVPEGEPQTKPRACNFGLMQARGQFVVIFDAEDKPEPYQLKKAVLTFANHGAELACVQAKLNYYNPDQNLLTRWFTAEYSTWFDILLPGLQRVGFSLPLGGTSNHFRTEVLRALGGWDAFNVTEDCDLGLRISQYGLKTAVLDSTTYEEATSRYKTWLFQRSRWNKGYLQTYLVHMRHPLRMVLQGHLRKFLSLQIIVGAWTLVLLLNPIMWGLTLTYIVFRPIQLYSELFPGPVLYAGAFCLIFGNFFYIYIHIVGCLRRKQYSLIKWVFLLPLYWILMSTAAYIAFYQLIVKPHYWEKTQHGNHLALSQHGQVGALQTNRLLEDRSVASSLPTVHVRAIGATLASTTQRVSAVRRNLLGQMGQRKIQRHGNLALLQDYWLIITLTVALAAGSATITYSFQHHLILIYNDAYSRLLLARAILDSATPGLAQLGGDWPPLPHLLMALFAWNDYLWQTGFAGSIVGLACYLISVAFIFFSARRITHNNGASFIGSLVFILNPNILYLQSTPLTEPVSWATFTIACYFMLAWVQDGKSKYLILSAIGTFLATLTRYDGWFLIAIFPIMIIIVDLLKRSSLRKIEGHLAVFLSLGSLGCMLWLLWDTIIFHDPLYFIRGPYSSRAQTASGKQGAVNALVARHMVIDIRLYSIDTVETLGIGVSVLLFLGLIIYLLRRWKSLDALAILVFLTPYVFYCAALYMGEVNMFSSTEPFYPLGIIPFSEGYHLFNGRFGSEMVIPAAIIIATLVPSLKFPNLFLRLSVYAWRGLLILFILAQSAWIASGGIISIIASSNPPFCVQTYAISVYLQEHYDRGYIFHAEVPFYISESEAGIDFKNVIYEGSGKLWLQALKNPASVADWVMFTPNDLVAQAVARDKDFAREYTLVATGTTTDATTIKLYHKNGLAPLPSRPISAYLAGEQQICTLSSTA
jgi:cellulose synthase/poly-beta-1,6-N-acetylglucosamine synthase-like glycosyltransferase